MKNKFLYLFFSFFITQGAIGQTGFWSSHQDNIQPEISSDWSRIKNLRMIHLDHQALLDHVNHHLNQTHKDFAPFTLMLPLPDGSFKKYILEESPVMEEGLAAKFPEIKTFKGYNGADYMRMSISPYSFSAFIISPEGDIIIEAPDRTKVNEYAVFYGKNIELRDPLSISCGTLDLGTSATADVAKDQKSIKPRSPQADPVDLRTYRVAIACTGEWGSSLNLGGGTVQSAIDKMVSSLSYINAVYEKEVAVHLNLITNNDKLIFLEPVTDPYGNPTSGGATLGINTDVITGTVGRAAYDVGHVFTIGCTDVGGVAFLGSVCRGNKGGGVTCWYTSDIAYVNLRIVCHEMGHQFNASHTFSNCNGNESATSYEPGSGTSIMSYSGLCGGALNVESGNLPHPNYFHTNSVERIYFYTRQAEGSTCGVQTATNNTFPEPRILFPTGLSIPIRTPFFLRGDATDEQNDALTYNWEQYDAGGYGPALGEPLLDQEGPLFKSVFPGNSPMRVVPTWNTVLTRANFERTEVLPTVDRKITFRFNVRDNYPGSGAVKTKEVYFNAVESAGPFKVTYPNVQTVDKLYSGSCNQIRWDVANTNKSPVNCQAVNIYLMPNRTNPNIMIPLLMNTENDGEALVTVPDSLVGMIRARIIIEAADNIFFDASDGDIRILADSVASQLNFSVSPKNFVFCIPDAIDLDIFSCTSSLQNGQIALQVISGLPPGASYQFDKSAIDYSGQAKLRLDFTGVSVSGIYNVEVIGITDKGDTLREFIELDLVNVDFSELKPLYPASGLSGLPQSVEFKWNKSPNALSYRLEIATSPAFGNSVIFAVDGILTDSYRPILILEESKIYYWRVIPVNRCGLGSPTLTSVFQTVNKKCELTDYIGNALVRSRDKTGFMPMTIRGAGTISDVNLKEFTATATGVNSITLTLVSPQGTRVKLFDRNCGVTGEFDCSFDDDGIFTLQNGCPPIQGKVIRPLEPLASFNGENKQGDWTIEVVTDKFLSGFATFYGFSLDICSNIIVSNPFLVKNIGLFLNPGETRGIPVDLLEAQDVDNGPSELKFTIVAIPNKGDLLINGAVATYGSSFTQKDINDGKLSYHHTGSQMETDGFLFIVEDGTGGWFGADYFPINIGVVSSDDPKSDLELDVYPNPNQGAIQLVSSKLLDRNAVVRIFDLQGREKMKVQFGNRTAGVLDISELSNGIYVLELFSGKTHALRKIVVAKD